MHKTDKQDSAVRHELERLPNVGPRMADDLLRLGIRRVEDLARRDADELYEAICAIDGVRHDPCVWDVFASLVDYARGGPPRRWWEYSAIRKERDRAARDEYRLDNAAIRTTTAPRPGRPRHPMPSFVRKALEERGLLDAYESRPPYQRNDYLGWILRARRADTRQTRFAQMLAELASGDQYMGMRYRSTGRPGEAGPHPPVRADGRVRGRRPHRAPRGANRPVSC